MSGARSDHARFGAVILAAGASSRFGSQKLLALLDGRPILQHVLDAVACLGPTETVVVLGDAADSIEAAVTWRAETRIRNPDPGRGLASSLRLGVEALLRSGSSLDAALLALGDQPRVRSEVVAALLVAARGANRPIVAPRYAKDAAPNPVVLLRAAWPLVAELRGDRGLGPLIAARPDLVTWVPLAGSNPDVDTPADLEALG